MCDSAMDLGPEKGHCGDKWRNVTKVYRLCNSGVSALMVVIIVMWLYKMLTFGDSG